MRTLHASEDVLMAMRGEIPSYWLRDEHIRTSPLQFHAACNGDSCREEDAVFACNGADNHGDDRDANCVECIALYPPEIRVRMDYLETRLPPPHCPSCDFGPFIPMRAADGFNHRAVAGSTHVCTACGKGWRP